MTPPLGASLITAVMLLGAQPAPAPAPAPAAQAAPVPAQPSGEYRAELSNTDVALTYHVSPTDLTVAQRVRLELTVRAPAGWSVSWPAVGEKLGRATVIDTTDTRDGSKQTRTITLEPYLPGADTIPSLSVSVSPRDPQSGAAPVTLTTEPVPLAIKALLSDEAAAAPVIPEFRPARDADDGDSWWTPRRIGKVAAFAVPLGLGLIAVMYKTMARRRVPADPAAQALARIDAVAGAPAPASMPQRNASLDDLAHAAREFLQARGVDNAVGAATPDLAPRIARVPTLAPTAGRASELLASIDAARFDPRHEGVLPSTIAGELAGVLRPALTPPAQEARA